MTTVVIASAAFAGSVFGYATAVGVRRIDPALNPRWMPVMLSAGWTLAAAAHVGVLAFPLIWWGVLLSGIDIGSRRLPNVLTGGGAVAVTAYSAAMGTALPVVGGAAALFCCYLVVHLWRPAAFGAGDVKLAFAAGGMAAIAGADAWAAAAVLAPLLTGLMGALATVAGTASRTVPHGPSMCLSTLLVMSALPT